MSVKSEDGGYCVLCVSYVIDFMRWFVKICEMYLSAFHSWNLNKSFIKRDYYFLFFQLCGLIRKDCTEFQ